MLKKSRLYKFALDLLFPELCLGCMQEGSYLCLACQNKITIPIQRCCVCGRGSLMGIVHPDCRSSSPLDSILVAADYDLVAVRNLIWNLKYNSVRDIGLVLGTLLADFIVAQDLESFFENSIVIPVPLHEKRQRMRGFNQAAILGQSFASRLGFEYREVLKRTKNTARQVDLEKQERMDNVKDAFALAPNALPLQDRRIILIDDVATTGTTLNECAKALRQSGPGSIWALVAARN